MRAFAILVVVFLALSGCTESESAPTQEASQLPAYLKEALGAGATAITEGDAAWTVLDAAAGPDSPVLAFTWTLDPAAVVESVDSDGQLTAVLEMAALLPADATLDAVAIQAFVETASGLVAAGGFYCPTLDILVEEAGGAVESYTRAPPMLPVLLKLGTGLVEGGERIHFIVASTATEAVDWGLAFRSLATDLAYGDQLPDAQAFLQAAQGAPLLLEPVARGAGLEMATYLDSVTGTVRTRAVSAFVDVVDRDPLPDLAAEARFDRALSAGLDSQGGYATVLGLFEGGAGSGEWSLTGDLRGVPLEASGTYTNANPTGLPLPTDALAEAPFLMAQADGLGASTSTFDLDLASAGEYARIFYFQADIGASVEELLGLPVADVPLAAVGQAWLLDRCVAQVRGPGLPTLVADLGC